MTIYKTTTRILVPAVIVLVLSAATIAFATGKQDGYAQEVNTARPTPQMVGANTPPPVPPFLPRVQAQIQPAALSTVLSYYFIPGNTFTPDGNVSYTRQATGCVNQMPLNFPFSAPVHLPQSSQVVSITLYTFDSAITTTVSSAYFILSDGKGLAGYSVFASSQPNTANYQQHDSTQNNPATIDNQNYNYYIQWRTSGTYDSPYLSLCGVRVAYYAPLGATYLPYITKQ